MSPPAAVPSSSSSFPPGIIKSAASQMSSQKERDPEFVTLILSGRAGARMFPLTKDVEQPQQRQGGSGPDTSSKLDDETKSDGRKAAKLKHLLPLGGEPVILRLLNSVQCSDITNVILAVAQHDTLTLHVLKEHYKSATVSTVQLFTSSLSSAGGTNVGTLTLLTVPGKAKQAPAFTISIVHLSADSVGSADAVRYLATLNTTSGTAANRKPLLPLTSNVLLLTADLVLEGKGLLGLLADAHRRGSVIGSCSNGTAAVASITMLLSDVGEEDENGVPLKESAKVCIY